jgi:ABC-2 type transport system permease protein
MRQLLAIAWKDTYLRFTDRIQVVIMLVTPLLLSTIIGMAFGGSSGGQVIFSDIPIAIVNLDTGSEVGGQDLNLGAIFTTVFVPTATVSQTTDTTECGTETNSSADSQQSLDDLFNTTVLTDAAIARAGVDDGTYAAAIVIPADFTAKLSPVITQDSATITGTQVEVYANSGSPIQASIVRSVTTSIIDQFVTGNVTIAVTIGEMINLAQSGNLGLTAAMLTGLATNSVGLNFGCAFVPMEGMVTIQQQPLDAIQAESAFVVILVVIGSAQAAYFALFTGQFGILNLFDEKEAGTLQRMLVTPTPRNIIVFGKILGVVLSVLLQLALLLTAFTLIASIVEGQAMFIWGNNPVMLILLVLMTVLAICGVSILVVGLATSAEQARIIAPLVNAGLGALAGAFGFRVPEAIARFSPLYWSVNGFQRLAGGDNAIGLHLAALFVLGLVTAAVGLWLFNRKIEV